MSLPPVRRIVTGHSPDGKAIIDQDIELTPHLIHTKHLPASDQPARRFTLVWRTESYPAEIQGPWTEYHGKNIPLSTSDGTTVRVVDFPAGRDGIMHRTVSIDFGVVLEGEIVLELDGGVQTTMKKGVCKRFVWPARLLAFPSTRARF